MQIKWSLQVTTCLMCTYLSGNLPIFYKFIMLFMMFSLMMSCLFIKLPFLLTQQNMKNNRRKNDEK